MLKRLVILNSDIYSKADIELENCDSLQIVGPNNIGKSTLIYALNFLYIIDGKQMTFSGNRTGDKATINHYFPSINSSFIVFEIFKRRYYSILIKKNAEGRLEYYKIDSDYKEEAYFSKTEKGDQLRTFDSLLAEFSATGIEYSKFSNRREVFNFVYQKGKRNNGVVWLDPNVSIDARGISNNFSKIYKYLINSKLINNESLKGSLVVADNKENENVKFSKKNQKDIQALLKHNRAIKVIKSIQKNFSEFKELVREHDGKSVIISELAFAFNQRYSATYNELSSNLSKLNNKIDAETRNLNENLEPNRKKLVELVGVLKERLNNKKNEAAGKENLIKEIKSFEGLPFLKQSHQNLEKERKNIETQITQIENQNISSKEIEQTIESDEYKISKIKNQIRDYSHQLIHQISDKQENKEFINRILSDDITTLSKDHIAKKINQLKNTLALFDGEIQLPDSLTGKAIVSVEELNSQLKKLEKKKETNLKLLPIARDLEKYREELSGINAEIQSINAKIENIENLPALKKEFARLQSEIANLTEKRENKRKEIASLEDDIKKLNESLKVLNEDILAKKQTIKEIQNWKVEIEEYGIQPVEYQSDDTLENIYTNFKRNFEERKDIRSKRDILFEKLKHKTETSYASANDFIQFINSELATLGDKQRSINGLLQSISTQFANPCRTICSRFDEFKAFITNQFNSQIRKIQISDIDSLKIEIIENESLLKDLKEIMEIRDLTYELMFDDQSDNLKTLNRYLDNQKTISFNDLFDIRLHLVKNGQQKFVDLKNQIESDGTDKMIRLVIIMAIINQIIVNDPENKIVLFIDEIGTIDEANRIEILNFCKQYNFIPISAAPLHPYDGFDKYYLIRRSKGKIVVSEKNGNVILRKAAEAT
jgi:chromosome segregation ATPase